MTTEKECLKTGIPPFPHAMAVQREAAAIGFDWPDISGVLDKVAEELDEIQGALAEGDRVEAGNELGDLLFAAVSVARFLNIDPEEALAAATNRFVCRVEAVKVQAAAEGRTIESYSLEGLDALWERVKRLMRQ